MALLKAFVCQVVLFGLYKLFLEQVVEDHLVPDELTRNCLVGVVCLFCFGIQIYSEKVEEQTSHGSSKSKDRRRSRPDTAESVSEFLDDRTAHMIRTLDAAMQQMSQMPMSDGYVQNVVFATAAPEQTFATKQPDRVVIKEIYTSKLDDVIYETEKSEVSANEPIVLPSKVEEVSSEKQIEDEEVEEEEEDVVTVIDASKPKPEASESEEEEEVEQPATKTEEKPVAKQSKIEVEEEEEESEEEESEEVEVEPVKVTLNIKKNEKADEKPVAKPLKVEVEEESEEEESEEEEEASEEETEVKQEKVTKKS